MSVTTKTVSSGYSTGTINENFQTLEDYINSNLLNRDGTSVGESNQMEVGLDMNSNFVYNLPEPVLEHQAARLRDVQNAIAGADQANLITFTPYGSISSGNVQGALEEVSDALDQRVIYVDTIADLQALPASELVDGQQALLGGVNSGAFEFDALNTTTPDGYYFVAPDSDPSGASGVWVRRPGGALRVSSYYGDDLASVQAMLDDAGASGREKVRLESGKSYSFDGLLQVPNGVTLDADGTVITLGLAGGIRLGNNSTLSARGSSINCVSGYAGTVFQRISTSTAGISNIIGFPAVTNLSDAAALESSSRCILGSGFFRSRVEVISSGFNTTFFCAANTVQCYYNEFHLFMIGGTPGRVTYGIRCSGELFNGNHFYINQCNGMDYGVFSEGETAGITYHLKYMENIYKDGFRFDNASSPTIIGGTIEGVEDPLTGLIGFGINNRGTTNGLTVVGTAFGRDFSGSGNKINQVSTCTRTTLLLPRDENFINYSGVISTVYFAENTVSTNSGTYSGRKTSVDGDATPDVTDTDYLILSNSSATSVTDFDLRNVRDVKEITVFATNGNTTLVNGTPLRIVGGANVTLSGSQLMRFVKFAGVSPGWFECYRNF